MLVHTCPSCSKTHEVNHEAVQRALCPACDKAVVQVTTCPH
jgi:ssDNA-binding Zn-finger/Zn-ribbon topoisomerase 1